MTAARRLAASMARRAVHAAQTDPVARGADWRLATVQTVNSDGTIATADGITARCLASYAHPAAGDLVVLSQSGSGNWIVHGRTSTATSAWTPFAYASPWADRGGSPGYCLDGRTVRLRGNIKTTASITNGATIATLPSGFRPQVFDYYVVGYSVTGYSTTYLTISPDGTIVYNGASGTVSYLFVGGITIPLY